MDELVKEFDISGISKSPAIFDILKLNYINSEYIKRLSADEFYDTALPWITKGVTRKDVDMRLIASVLHQRTEVLSDIPPQLDFIDALPEYDLGLYENKKMKTNRETALEVLKQILPVIKELDDFTFDSIHAAMFALIEKLGVKNGYLLWPLRVALSGKQFTPGGGIEIAAIIGKEDSVSRIEKAIALLSENQ